MVSLPLALTRHMHLSMHLYNLHYRSPSSARSLGLWAVSSAESHRLDIVRTHLPDLLRAVASVRMIETSTASPSPSPSSSSTSNSSHEHSIPPLQSLSLTSDDMDKLGFLIMGAPVNKETSGCIPTTSSSSSSSVEFFECEGRLSSLAPTAAMTSWSNGKTWPACDAQQWLLANLSTHDGLYPPTPPPQRFTPQVNSNIGGGGGGINKSLNFDGMDGVGNSYHSPPQSSASHKSAATTAVSVSPNKQPSMQQSDSSSTSSSSGEVTESVLLANDRRVEVPDRSVELFPPMDMLPPLPPNTTSSRSSSSSACSRPLPRVINSVAHRTVFCRSSLTKEAYSAWKTQQQQQSSLSIHSEIAFSDLMVNHCQDSHLYLLEPFRHATLVGCSDCTIVIGAIQGNTCDMHACIYM